MKSNTNTKVQLQNFTVWGPMDEKYAGKRIILKCFLKKKASAMRIQLS
jgi:hypothetical protein